MHPEAFAFVERIVRSLPPRRCVVEVGSLNVNGSVRPLFPLLAHYHGIDTRPGKGVDEVADGATWQPPSDLAIDCVVTCEVLEHTPRAPEICANARRILTTGGVFIVTAAGVGRPRHGIDGGQVAAGEYYRNVPADELREWLGGFHAALVETRADDVYAVAFR